MPNQSNTFLQGEADNYFRRNKTALDSAAATWGKEFSEIDWLHQALAPFKDKIHAVLEIGCSNGVKLERICDLLDAEGSGIDPSQLAVAEGNQKSRERKIQLHAGTASSLPFEPQSFDFVYFGFCLYLLDRQDLFSAIAEADRVLKTGGFLAITDFDPVRQHKRPYHHQTGVFSFKQDYSKFFTESGTYYLVSKNSFSHRQSFFDTDGNERVSTTLLFKEIEAY
jgi:ubiquinone/menaquinone biosynthesis C-methylase UbiE